MTYYSWRKPHYNEEELEIVRNFFTDTQHYMLQVLVMFAHENEVPEQEGWNMKTYNNLFDEVMK